MSTAYAGVNTFPTTIPLASDGDPKFAASVTAALQGLKDATIYLANLHTGANPAGILKGPTIRGNATYTKDGSNRSHSFVDANIAIDDLSDLTINGPAGSSPTISISRNVNWPEGNHTFGGASGQTVTINGPLFLGSPVELVGAARFKARCAYMAAGDTDKAISIVAADVHVLRLGEIAATRKAILANGVLGVASTDLLRLVSYESTQFLDVYAADGVTALGDANNSNIRLKAGATGAGVYAAVLMRWTGAFWEWIGQ